MRYLILIHRYLGIAIGIVLVGWCLTGIVMLYVRYPALAQAERLQRLRPLNLSACCQVGPQALPADAPIESFEIEDRSGHAVLTVQSPDWGRRQIDLVSGLSASNVSAQEAATLAAPGAPRRPRLLGLIRYDEWTVSGEFNRARPLYLFALDDAADTQIYVSGQSGRVVQLTTAHQRFWNWLGAVPHWLYFTQLRHQPKLWTKVVIWTSLAGCFLALFGLYLGTHHFLRRPEGRWSGYRGVMYWHHVLGLVFGLFALTWVASGLVSMNPWGFLDSDGAAPEVDAMIGPPIRGAQVAQWVHALPESRVQDGTLALESTRLWGEPYLLQTALDGTRRRLHWDGSPGPLSPAEWRRIATALGGPTAALELLAEGDAYYHSRPGVVARLPIYRVLSNSQSKTRYYLDPVTGTPVEVMDGDAREYRWLHVALHTFDFSVLTRNRPLWDVLMILLLGGTALVCGTGTWVGWRRYLRVRNSR